MDFFNYIFRSGQINFMETSLQDNNSKQKNNNSSESDSSIKVQHFQENFDFLGQVLWDKKEIVQGVPEEWQLMW